MDVDRKGKMSSKIFHLIMPLNKLILSIDNYRKPIHVLSGKMTLVNKEYF